MIGAIFSNMFFIDVSYRSSSTCLKYLNHISKVTLPPYCFGGFAVLRFWDLHYSPVSYIQVFNILGKIQSSTEQGKSDCSPVKNSSKIEIKAAPSEPKCQTEKGTYIIYG